jgi:hypothetical protein
MFERFLNGVPLQETTRENLYDEYLKIDIKAGQPEMVKAFIVVKALQQSRQLLNVIRPINTRLSISLRSMRPAGLNANGW